MSGTFGAKHALVTSCATRIIIFQRGNLNYLIVCITQCTGSVPCFFKTFCFLLPIVCLALSVENVCNETSRPVTTEVLAKQNRSSRIFKAVKLCNDC